MAYIRNSRPAYGLGFQVQDLNTSKVFPPRLAVDLERLDALALRNALRLYREVETPFTILRTFNERQGQSLALTVSYVPYLSGSI